MFLSPFCANPLCLWPLNATIRPLPAQDLIISIAFWFPSSVAAVPIVRSVLSSEKNNPELLKDAAATLTNLLLTMLVQHVSSGSSEGGGIGLK